MGANHRHPSKAVRIEMAPDQQRLLLETSQVFGYGIILAVMALAALAAGIYEIFFAPGLPPLVLSPDVQIPRSRNFGTSGQLVILLTLIIAGSAAFELHRGPKVEAVLDRVAQLVQVRSSYFGRHKRTVTVPLSSITSTRLVGMNDRFNAYARLVADHNDGSIRLTGKTDVSAADEAQKAVRGFLGLS